MGFFQTLFKSPILFIIEGESNSGGLAMTSVRPSGEIGLQTHVSILNNISLSIEPLVIGGASGNNLLGHFYSTYPNSFGFELGIAKRAKNNPSFYTDRTYLLKTGQGGSTIAEWATGGGYDTRSVNLSNAIRTQIINYRRVIFYSLGINDSNNSTSIATWKAAVKARFNVLRSRWGVDTAIVMTQFQGIRNTYDASMAEICQEMPNVYSINTAGATTNNNAISDGLHWGGDNTGMPYVTSLMLDIVEQKVF